jgi:hypothetical protein
MQQVVYAVSCGMNAPQMDRGRGASYSARWVAAGADLVIEVPGAVTVYSLPSMAGQSVEHATERTAT